MKRKRTRAAANARPTKASLGDFPEVDFSRGIRPHRYAQLQTGYKNHVFVDHDVFEFFGSAEAINKALRFLVEAAAQGGARPPSRTRSRKAA